MHGFVRARWGSICWFSTSLIFHRVIFALPTAHLFLLSRWICLSKDINNHKQSHDSFTSPSAFPSRYPWPSLTQDWSQLVLIAHSLHISVCNWWKANIINSSFSQTMHTHTVHNHTHTHKFTHAVPWLMPWLSVCSPITDSNYRQSPCVSITSQHNALIRPGLI